MSKTEAPGAAEFAALVEKLSKILLARGWRMATAESCTGGWIAKCCTDRPGSSAWFDRGFVSYSDRAKQELLGVEPGTLRAHGAVSEAVALQMAEGALQRAAVEAAVAVTGVAGPDGGSIEKPVGTVWFAWATESQSQAECLRFDGDRDAVRRQTVQRALLGMIDRL